MPQQHVLIIGGGISGLSTAYYLAKAGIRSTIIESRPRLGGVIQTEQIDGCTVEAGPDSFLSAKPAALELIRELGLASDVIGSNDHLRVTYIRKRGRLVPLPDGLMMMVPTKVMPLVTTPLLSWATKARMGLELVLPPKPRMEDESVADFVRAHYGQEAVDYLAEPLLSGIYGGDPSQLSVRSVLPRFADIANRYGSLTRGVLAQKKSNGTAAPLFRTLKGGLQQLVNALSGNAHVVQGRAEAIEQNRVRVAGQWLEGTQVVLACEAHSAASLVGGRMAELLGAVGYTSSSIVVFGFDAGDFSRPPEGFGFLIPKKERRTLVACTWVGTKFPHRVPAGKIVARCFVSGLDPQEETVLHELQDIADFRARPKFSRVYRWPRAMAQYPVGHAERTAELTSIVAATPGLHLAGNAYDGIGIPDCIRMAKSVAERIRT